MYGPAEVDTRSSKNTAGTPAGGRNRELAGQILRFGVTGVLNTSIRLVILFVLNERYGVDEWIASFIGYAVATVHSSIVSKFWRSEEHTSELQSLMRISYAVFCLKKNKLLNIHKLTNHPLYNHSTRPHTTFVVHIL